MQYKYADYKTYYNVEDVNGYELFIGPNGEYYKVKTIYESDQDCTHYEWAIGYIEKNNLQPLREHKYIKDKCNTDIQILINYLGFIRFTHASVSATPIFTFPNKHYFGYRINNLQITAIYNLIKNHNKDFVDSIISKLNNEEIEYEQKIDKVFKKLLINGR